MNSILLIIINMKSIQTKYRGYTFRSRLEARWAVFFDLCNWRWEYEPVDFDGWLPDFALYGKDILYVEVKPIIDLPEWLTIKIDKSGCKEEVLVLGQTNPIINSEYYPTHCQIGWLRENIYNDEYRSTWWQNAFYTRMKDLHSECKTPGGLIGFFPEYGAYNDRITGCYNGGHHGIYNINCDKIKSLWGEAQNIVKWYPKQYQK